MLTKGILNIDNSDNYKPDCQIIFVDTPGLFEPKKALEKHIVNNTISELNNYAAHEAGSLEGA